VLCPIHCLFRQIFSLFFADLRLFPRGRLGEQWPESAIILLSYPAFPSLLHRNFTRFYLPFLGRSSLRLLTQETPSCSFFWFLCEAALTLKHEIKPSGHLPRVIPTPSSTIVCSFPLTSIQSIPALFRFLDSF